MEMVLLFHVFLAIVSAYLTYCAKLDNPELKKRTDISFCIGLLFGWLGLIIVLLSLLYEIAKNHSRGV